MATGNDAAPKPIEPRDLGVPAEPAESDEQEDRAPSAVDLDLEILINSQLAAKHASAAAAAALRRFLLARESVAGEHDVDAHGRKRRKLFMDRARDMVQPDTTSKGEKQ